MNVTFKRNLAIGFGISLVILILSTLASYLSITGLLNSAADVAHTRKIISDIDGTLSVLKDAETGQRGYLITGNENFLEPYNGAYDSAINLIRNIKGSTQDNAEQQENSEILRRLIEQRIKMLDRLISQKRDGELVSITSLDSGKFYMDSARRHTARMIDLEARALTARNEKFQNAQSYVIALILVAAAVAILITVIFYLRVRNDYEDRSRLAADLKKTDDETRRRISIIEEVANRISSGDYSVRIADEKKDSLGSLADSINHMAESLQYSFNTLSDKEWVQTGLAGLSSRTLGQQDVQKLTSNIIDFVTEYTNSHVGVLYLLKGTSLSLISSHGLADARSRRDFEYGEGIVGQCARSEKPIKLSEIPDGHLTISFATASVKPTSIIAAPVFTDGRVSGVIELAAMHDYSANEQTFLNMLCQSIGILIEGSVSRARLQDLLEETQAQSEELLSQHTELEQINAELEIKSEKLQGSEEELKVQQEELLQANTELEERAALLEEKNQEILASNIQIEAKAQELALSSRYKSEFLANMSHELRTPLNSILLLSGLMSENAEGKLREEEVEYARVIQSSGNGLLALIDEILDLSKIESGKMDLLIEKIAVADIVSSLNDSTLR